MYRKRTAPDASPEAVKQMTEARRERSPEKRAIPPLRASMRMHSKSRGAMMVEAAKKNKEAQKSPVRSAKSSLPLVPSTPQKRKDPRPSQLIQYGKEKPDNNLDALFKRRKEQQQSISGFRGMENLGNTCYMNAVLQVLTSLDTFASDMQNKQLLDASMPDDGVYKALLQVTKEKKLTGMSRGINPVALKRSVAKNSSRFEGARQQDAHEFLCNLLDQVQEEVFHHYEKKLLPQESSKLQLQDTRCPTSLNFSCIVEHELVCDSCGESSEVRELFRHLSLDIPERKPGEANGPPNLQELLELYFKDEPLEKTCEKCGCLTCTVKHRVRRLPRVLVLHMKRFCVKIDGPVQRYVKRQDPVRIEPLLNLGPVCCPLTKGPIPFGDQARPSPSQNKAPKTPQSPRRTLADVSNTWQAAAGESPAKSARRASISASSGAFLGPEAVGRIRGGFSVASDGSSGSGIGEGGDRDSGETSGERDECNDVRMDEANAEGDAGAEEDTASSMEGVVEEPRPWFSHAQLAAVEPQRLRGGGAQPDSDPYALEPTASEVLEQSMSEALERTMRDRAAEVEAVNSGRIAERKRASTEAGLSLRKSDSIYTRPSPYETSGNPYEAYKNLPPGARFGTAAALKVAERSQTPGTQTPRFSATAGKRGEPVIRKPGKSISTVKNLFKSAGEKREEEAAMLFSPGSKRPKTRAEQAERAESRNASVVDLEADEDAELARVLAESEKEFAAQRGGDTGPAGADVSREQEQLDRAIALSLQEAAAAIEREDVPTPAPGLDRAAPSSPTVEIADDAVSGPEPPEPFSTAYRLHGIISHLGTLASSGHFIADVYDTASEQWVRHDDSVVAVVSRSTVLNEKREVDGYMFFYVHEPLVKQQKLACQQARDSSKLKLEGRF